MAVSEIINNSEESVLQYFLASANDCMLLFLKQMHWRLAWN